MKRAKQLGLALGRLAKVAVTVRHGGKRVGAGRKRKLTRDPVHEVRPPISGRNPLHVVLRTRAGVGRLRTGRVLGAVKHAAWRVGSREESFRVIHVSIQHNHLHLIVEAASEVALSRGMQAFAISAAKSINRVVGRAGSLFAHRYHATELVAPRQVRNAIAYVLNNWRRHDKDTRGLEAFHAPLDGYASGVMFDGWKENGPLRASLPAWATPWPTSAPRTWMLREGWRKARRPISLWDVPVGLAA